MKKFINWLRFIFRGFLTPAFDKKPRPAKPRVFKDEGSVRVVASSVPVCANCKQEVGNPFTHNCEISVQDMINNQYLKSLSELSAVEFRKLYLNDWTELPEEKKPADPRFATIRGEIHERHWIESRPK